ncbi:cyclic-phosphate processing receiver domain-containing protein [Paenibacillus hamazuiensis]|uniref:cyclic-phosphate processing receiver domain-containing protein n=1 Tax=Paenibacillus hamazuiensis TaxID=2936508 RepID=UPI00200C5946|nr:cyclic-phosphate processing receiver domain-containing protein [Paenibacillus hamazuiensis]
MIRVFLDDMRRCPEGFVLAKDAAECILLLEQCEVEVLSLDYDLGPGQPTGLEVVMHMVRKRLFPREIYLHTSSASGRVSMFNLLYAHKPEGTVLYNHPIPPEKAAEWILQRKRESENGNKDTDGS